ncbi:MAG: hypothetical protein E7463_02485 [Ruminococcaceae bacterium]|nr:hypothetical protein [Oscillospiraceae bacterium]
MKAIIAIAGGSAGGKTTFARKLQSLLESYRVCMLHTDTYFRPTSERPSVQSHLNDKIYVDDNCPDAIDFDRYHADFDAACASDCEVIITEGLWVLWDTYIRDRINLRVYVDCRSDERIVRRLRRNMGWGLTFDQIADFYLDMVRFRHEQYIEPTKWTADLIINGTGNTDIACRMCADQIEKLCAREDV